MSSNVYKHYPPKLIIRDYSFFLNDNLRIVEKYLTFYFSIPGIESKTSANFIPSKTAQNGLNFISKEDELHLLKEDLSQLPAYEEIIKIFKILLILLKQNFDGYDNSLLPSLLMENVMKKFKIENFSKW